LRAALLCALALAGCAARRPRPAPPPSSGAKAVVRAARSYLPEENPKGRKPPKDCSDFVDKVFAENGMKLPRTTVEMALLGKRVKTAKELRMGDLVFFSGERIDRQIGHVGIYVNNGIFIHLSRPEIGVRMESLYSDYYRQRYLTARRLKL
jgi:cell wall-associated NlpC family hydrolase